MMDQSTRKTLVDFAQKANDAMKRKASKYSATGGTVRAFRYEVTDKGLMMFGAAHLPWMETGRGPTREGAPKGDPTLYEAILKWVKAKRLTPKEEEMTESQLAWRITKKIHKEGTRLWRDKGFRDIYTATVSDAAVAKVIDKIRGDYVIATSSELIKIFNQLLDTRKAA